MEEAASAGCGGHYNLLRPAIATIPVVVTGILAWQWELEDRN